MQNTITTMLHPFTSSKNIDLELTIPASFVADFTLQLFYELIHPFLP